jgi:ribonuclease Z
LEDDQIKAYTDRMDLQDLKVCFVKHCPHSFGVTMTMKNLMKSPQNPNESVKITYSGDTMPCESLINIGKNSDILIHEATMEDDLHKEARAKMHSTVSEAIAVGQKMNARFVVLTHFSQRYARIPLLMTNQPNVAIGFDNMEVTLNDLPMMHLMYDPLKCMFADHYELIESKNYRRKIMEDKKIVINQPLGNGKNKKMRFQGIGQE